MRSKTIWIGSFFFTASGLIALSLLTINSLPNHTSNFQAAPVLSVTGTGANTYPGHNFSLAEALTISQSGGVVYLSEPSSNLLRIYQ
jgi:hypothetical protein